MSAPSGWIANWLGFNRPVVARVEAVDSAFAELLAAIHDQSFAHGWSATEFERLLSDRATIADGLFIAREKSPCGFVLSRRVLDEAEILSIAINPARRRHGLSSKLLSQHRESLIKSGVRVLHLEVDENNAPALALYAAAGFAITGRRRGYYAHADGSRTTALTMTLKL